MFDYWKRLDALSHINRLLLAFIAALIIFSVFLLAALIKAPERVEFWLAPNMNANGGLIKAGEIPDEYVHGFATSLIPSLNTWSQSGRQEFEANMQGFHYYFTSRHQSLVSQTFLAYQNAQLFNRSQVASLYRFMEKSDVRRLGKDSWEVHLVLRITQRLNDKSPMVIADKVVDYHIRVVKVNLSKILNPFQLALDGYTQPEKLVKDLLSQETEGENP